ncbi:ParH-like protein [Kitasatospora sp. NPDC094019]|uniref:ParH-like protein n=1 Tax=Kitasatospora sp. NPDC094019 TaxID=3364091 RepID=UPI00380ED607
MGHPGEVERSLWLRCRGVADSIPLPEPFGIRALTDSLARRRGRPIELIPLSGPAHSPCGVLVSTDRADYIGYAVDTTTLHQQHIVLHEIGHLLCRHTGVGPGLGEEVREALTPRLSGELVRRVLGRSAYTQRQEREAELVASLALHRVLLRRRSSLVGHLAEGVLRSVPGLGGAREHGAARARHGVQHG